MAEHHPVLPPVHDYICECHGRTFRRASSLGMHLYHERRKAERIEAERAEDMQRVIARRYADEAQRLDAAKEQHAYAEAVERELVPAVLTLLSPEARRESQDRAYEAGVREERERILAALDEAAPALMVDGGGCCDRRAAKVVAWVRKVVACE